MRKNARISCGWRRNLAVSLEDNSGIYISIFKNSQTLGALISTSGMLPYKYNRTEPQRYM